MAALQQNLLTANVAHPIDVVCMATSDGSCDFKPRRFQRRPLNPSDILIDMKFCGVCHTDVHAAMGDLAAIAGARYPCVPGHELAGVCVAVGSAVTRFKPGDHIGVGCMVDSCLSCAACKRGEEQMCSSQVGTYGALDKSGRAAPAPGQPRHTLGGYTSAFVVQEKFAVLIPPGFPLEAAGPVMCAGVTLYDPLVRYGAGPGVKVAIVGVGGLGVMGLKIAKALGAHVTAVTRSAAKKAAALRCGADAVLVSGDAGAMAAAGGSFDLVLNTIPSEHDIGPYTALLSKRGNHVVLGLNSALIAGFAVSALTCGASRVKGSGIGGIAATQAVIDLCASRDIKPELKVVQPEDINGVYVDLQSGNDNGLRCALPYFSAPHWHPHFIHLTPQHAHA